MQAFLKWLVSIIAITIVNYVTGKLCLLLALPPGYITGIWVPAGVALAAVLLFGYNIWPGIWLASLLINISILPDAHQWTLLGFAISASIATGSTAQAIIGAYLIRRFVPKFSKLNSDRDIFLVVALGALSCLFASSWGVITIYLFKEITLEELPYSWFTWWVGDNIGVVIITPLILLWSESILKRDFSRLVAVTFPLLCTFFLSTILFAYTSRWEQQDIKNKFEKDAKDIYDSIDRNLEQNLELVWTIRDFFVVTENMTQQTFNKFVRKALLGYNTLLVVEWAPLIKDKERVAFENKVSQDGEANFKISKMDADGKLTPASKEREYAPLEFLEPLEENQMLLGFDVLSAAWLRTTLIHARETGQTVATPCVRLLQDIVSKDPKNGITIVEPIFQMKNPFVKNSQREPLLGYLLADFRIHDAINEILLKRSNLSMKIVDPQSSADRHVLYSNIMDNEEIGFKWSRSLNFANRIWEVEILLPEKFLLRHKSWESWTVLVAAFVFTALLGILLLGITGRAALVKSLYYELSDRFSGNEKRLQAILHTIVDGIATFDKSTKILSLNESGKKIFNFEESDLAESSIKALFSQEMEPFFDQIVAREYNASKREVIHVDMPFEGKRRSGEAFPGELSLSTFSLQETRIFVAVLRDVTERKMAEDQIHAMVFSLKQSHEELEQFMHLASHDLRAPLLNMKGFTSELGKIYRQAEPIIDGFYGQMTDSQQKQTIQALSKDIPECLQYINGAVNTMEILTGEILRLLRLGRKALQFEEISTKNMVDQILANYHQVISQNNIQIEIGDLPSVTADAMALKQIFSNLIDNAIKYLDPERPGKISISGRKDKYVTVFKIVDNGRGIGETDLRKLFHFFHRGDNPDKSGEGVGLAYIRVLIRRHGGTISCISKLGEGTTFTFSLATPQAISHAGII